MAYDLLTKISEEKDKLKMELELNYSEGEENF
jgi:hypothetical protein